MNVLAVSVTEAGRSLAGRLPYELAHGRLAETVRARWGSVDGLVLFAATGVATRVVGPLLVDKRDDPAVVCVDEAGRFAVALCGGHAGGANALATEVAALLGAQPVVTTASDATGLPALDQLRGCVVRGDVAGVTAARLDGISPVVENEIGWALPPEWAGGVGPTRLVVTDRAVDVDDRAGPGVVVVHPPSLVVGVGASSDAPPDRVTALVAGALAGAGLARDSVAEVATLDRRAQDGVVRALGWPVRSFSAEQLAVVQVPTPSPVV